MRGSLIHDSERADVEAYNADCRALARFRRTVRALPSEIDDDTARLVETQRERLAALEHERDAAETRAEESDARYWAHQIEEE